MNPSTHAIYAGSFDPVTFGHMDIIKRACAMFECVEIAVCDNPNKKYMFSFNERVDMMKDALTLLGDSVRGKVGVTHSPVTMLTADHARTYGFGVLIKGARTAQDFDYEKLIHEVSLTQQRKLETVLLFSSNHLSHISSSAAKELAKYQGLVHEYVPLHVKAAIERKLGQRIIGVTGTIGSGKSTFCESLSRDNNEFHPDGPVAIHHVNMDKIAHELLTEKHLPIAVETRVKIEDTFGTSDRVELGKIVFGDSQALAKLNDIYREPILTMLRTKLLGVKGTILLEGALLTELDWLFLCNNEVVLVKTPSEQEHYNRLSSRGYTERQVENRLESQYTFEQKHKAIEKAIKASNFGKCVIHDTEKLASELHWHIHLADAYKFVNNE